MTATFEPMPRDPFELLRSVAAGDQQALADLYDAFSAALYGVVLRMVEKEEVAQEVLQDIFVKVWRNAEGYDPDKGRPFTWLVNIARNTAIDALRSAGMRNAGSIRPFDQHVYRLGEDTLNTDLAARDVRAVVGRLRNEHRELIEMAYFQGYSQQDIAERTGLPLGTVKSRTRAALLDLREQLKDHS